MPIARLSLTDFRSYASALITPGPGFVVLTGDNGAGKTNVLEAISLLTPGRGLRGSTLGDMARRGGAGGFAVNAHLTGTEAELGTGTLATAPERRVVRINSATTSATALGEWLSLVWLTPAQDRLFTDSAGTRRRFLDRLVLALDPGHAHHTTRYEAAMRQRNRLLAEDSADPDWLAALEQAMGEHGAAVTAARLRLVDELGARVADRADPDFPAARLQLSGTTEGNFAARLAASRAVHRTAGRATIGPQVEDLVVTHAAKALPAASSSTGEQKAMLIGIVLAHADLVAERQQRRPILLLDEVAAHLDPARRAALFARLAAGGGQVWLTGTEIAPFSAIGDATRYRVSEGALTLL